MCSVPFARALIKTAWRDVKAALAEYDSLHDEEAASRIQSLKTLEAKHRLATC